MKDQLLHLGRKTAIYGIGSILNRFISFLLLPLFTKYLTPTDYGISSILGWMAFLLTPIFSLGMGTAIATCYFEKDGDFRKEATIWSAFTILLVSASALLVLGVPFAEYWSQLAFQTPDFHYLVTVTFFSAALSILGTPFMMYLQFEERAKLYSVFTIITTLVSIGSNVLLVVVFHRGVNGLVEGYLITQVVNLVLFAFPAILKLKYRFQAGLGRELLRLGVPVIPSVAFLFVLQQGNRYILQMYGGLDDVGIYTIGYNFGMVMSVPIDALIVAWVPYFMGFIDRREEAQNLFGRIVTFYLIGFGVLSLLFYIFAKPVVMLMTQPAFHDAYQVVGLASTAGFLSGLFYLLVPAMYFAKEVKYQSLIQGLAAILGIGINFVLISKFQILGAGWGLVFGFFIMVVFTFLWNRKRKADYLQVHYDWKRIIVWGVCYAGYILLLQWKRDFSFIGESIFSLVMLISLPFLVIAMLSSWERQNVMILFRHFQTKMMGQSSDG